MTSLDFQFGRLIFSTLSSTTRTTGKSPTTSLSSLKMRILPFRRSGPKSSTWRKLTSRKVSQTGSTVRFRASTTRISCSLPRSLSRRARKSSAAFSSCPRPLLTRLSSRAASPDWAIHSRFRRSTMRSTRLAKATTTITTSRLWHTTRTPMG